MLGETCIHFWYCLPIVETWWQDISLPTFPANWAGYFTAVAGFTFVSSITSFTLPCQGTNKQHKLHNSSAVGHVAKTKVFLTCNFSSLILYLIYNPVMPAVVHTTHTAHVVPHAYMPCMFVTPNQQVTVYSIQSKPQQQSKRHSSRLLLPGLFNQHTWLV